MRDPLDSIVPAEARWEAFRRQLGSALLVQWFFSELKEIAPDYASDLHGRLEQAFLSYPDLFRADGDYDGWVPVQGPGDSVENVWMLEEDASALHEVFEARIGCGAVRAGGVRPATLTLAGPKWVGVRLARLEQEARVCDSAEETKQRPAWWTRRVLSRASLTFGVGAVVGRDGRVSAGPAVVADLSLNRQE